MKRSIIFFSALCLFISSCKKDSNITIPPASTKAPLLKDIAYQNLPSPYYYFEYDANGRTNKVAFASDAFSYNLFYQGNQLSEMKSIVASAKISTTYQYDNSGKLSFVRINSEDGSTVLKRGFLTYDNQNRLKEIEWELNTTAGFALQRTLSFTYHSDRNVAERRDRRHLIEGKQTEALYVERYEQYDDKLNVDGFSLLHEPSEHLVLFPGIQLQQNNPVKLIRTGDGVNYELTYTYTYNTNKQPIGRVGSMLITNGPQAGQTFQLNTSYSYYE